MLATLGLLGAAPRLRAQASLAQLWRGDAHFQEIGHIEPGHAAHTIVVKDGVWYDFYREWMRAKPGCSGGGNSIRLRVRASSDQGRSWSGSHIAAEPDPEHREFEGCDVVDGDAYYDRDEDVWHLLAQCLGTAGGWNLCHYMRRGSPLGRFERNPFNPVVRPNQLWGPICRGGGRCPASTHDEGTPQILGKSGDYFYVTFHGTSGSGDGYRGAAKTQDFRTWITRAGDLPGDNMYGTQDCESWNPGCVGGTAAHILRQGGYFYMVIEAPTFSISCIRGQRWFAGLARSTRLAAAGRWENFAQNPFLTHPVSPGTACGLQYAKLWQDGGRVFLDYEEGDVEHLLALVPGKAKCPIQLKDGRCIGGVNDVSLCPGCAYNGRCYASGHTECVGGELWKCFGPADPRKIAPNCGAPAPPSCPGCLHDGRCYASGQSDCVDGQLWQCFGLNDARPIGPCGD